MTVLIGICCTDGVVVGADSSATYMHGLTPIMEQNTGAKIRLVDEKVIIATSGDGGLGQRFTYHVEQQWRAKGFQADAHTVSTKLSASAVKDFHSTGVPRHSQMGWGCGALLAAPIADRHTLFEYDMIGLQPTRVTDDLRFVSAGSGQPLADPFLGFIRRVFWNREPPSIKEGIFGALWTLRHTIELNPGGIGGRPCISILERSHKAQWVARIVTEDECGEYEQHCEAAEEHLRGYRPFAEGQAATADAPDVPRPSGGS